jgi:glycosyltransferase involved in cell wall biosynthesis
VVQGEQKLKKYTSKEIKEFVSKPLFNEKVILNKDPNYPKISIVTPSYNQAQFLERTILSVLNQNYPNLEYIIIDGGSMDGSVDIIKKYEKYLIYWVSEKDRGQSNALNKGFYKASGDICGWLNADDLFLPDSFVKVIFAFKLSPNKKIVFGDYLNIDKNDNILELNYAFNFNLNHLIFEGFHNNAQATFWRSEVRHRFGLFDESLYYTMDYDMLLRFAINEGQKTFKRIPEVLACFRRHPLQKTQSFNKGALEEHIKIAKKLGIKRFIKPYKWLRILYRIRRGYWYLYRGGISYLLSKILGKYRFSVFFISI